MKNIFLTLFLSSMAFSISAQKIIQNGLVREHNSGKKPVPGVQIIFDKAVDASDGAGKFRLVFGDKRAGDLVFLTKIDKTGYELVNDKDLEHIILTNSDQWPTDIILAKTGVIENAKKDYYAISDSALKANYEKQKAWLRTELQKAKMTQLEYQHQYEALQRNYDNQKKVIDELSEQFAKVNFDDVSELYQEALLLFKKGMIDEAIKKLEDADLIGRTDRRLKIREENEKGIQEDLELLKLNAHFYALKSEIQKAEELYDRMLLLDNSNQYILLVCSFFYFNNHRYNKALNTYYKIITNEKSAEEHKALAYGNISQIFASMGQIDSSINATLKAKDNYVKLSTKYPQEFSYQRNVSISYFQLGEAYKNLGNPDTAITMYYTGHKGFMALSKSNPLNIAYKADLGDSWLTLGILQQELGNLDSALNLCKESFHLYEELHKADSNKVLFKIGLANAYSRIGEIQNTLGNTTLALKCYSSSFTLAQEIYKSDSINVEYIKSLAITYEKIGLILTNKNIRKLDGALLAFKAEIGLYENLHKEYPLNVDFTKGLSIAYQFMGYTYTLLDSLDKALIFLEYELNLTKELYENHPKYITFKDGLISSYIKLGIINKYKLKNKTKGHSYFKQAEKLLNELVQDGYLRFQKDLEKVQKFLEDL